MTGKKTTPWPATHLPPPRADSRVRRSSGSRNVAARSRSASSVPPPGADNSGVRPLPESIHPSPPPPAGSPLEHAVQIALRDGRLEHDPGERLELPVPSSSESAGSPLETALLRAAEGPGALLRSEPRRPRQQRKTPRAFPAVDIDKARRSTPPPPRPEQRPIAVEGADAVSEIAGLIDRSTPIPRVRSQRSLANTPRAYPPREGAAPASAAPASGERVAQVESGVPTGPDAVPTVGVMTRGPRTVIVLAIIVIAAVAYALWPTAATGEQAGEPGVSASQP